MFKEVNLVRMGFLAFAVIAYYSGQQTAAILTVPIYAVWITVHNIEVKVNALLDKKSIYMANE